MGSSASDTTFAIDWNGRYHIEGVAFIYIDRKSVGIRPNLGYPNAGVNTPRAVAEISNIFG
jgi:hypothetical protein